MSAAAATRRTPWLRPALVVADRDVRSALGTPLAYVLYAVFAAIAGVFFLYLLEAYSSASDLARTQAAGDPSVLARFSLDTQVVHPLLRSLAILLIVFAPLLTMRLLAEEERQGTMELLLTAPVPAGALVLGKFLAGLVLCVFPLALTAWFPLVLVVVGHPDLEPLLAGYLALVLLSSVFTAVGLLASSLTSSSLLAAFLGFVVLLGSILVGMVGANLPPELGAPLVWVSPLMHFETLLSGVVDTGDLAYFVLGTWGALHVALRVVESRRWR